MLIIFVIAITSTLVQLIGYLDVQLDFGLLKDQQSSNLLNIKVSIASVVICLALVRYFYIQDRWLRQNQKLSEARLNALQARIKPHFLFNSLNSIASLISIDAERAEVAIADFASLMRRTFMHKEKRITIKEELDWVTQYLSIEKLRLDKRLRYNVKCEEELLDKRIPVLCLQPLVENAILHGIQPLEHGGNIDINIFKDENKINIQVSNPFIPNKNTKSNGMALANIKERLNLQYGPKSYMEIKTNEDLYTIKLSIPL